MAPDPVPVRKRRQNTARLTFKQQLELMPDQEGGPRLPPAPPRVVLPPRPPSVQPKLSAPASKDAPPAITAQQAVEMNLPVQSLVHSKEHRQAALTAIAMHDLQLAQRAAQGERIQQPGSADLAQAIAGFQFTSMPQKTAAGRSKSVDGTGRGRKAATTRGRGRGRSAAGARSQSRSSRTAVPAAPAPVPRVVGCWMQMLS